jgi:hypothetical protein
VIVRLDKIVHDLVGSVVLFLENLLAIVQRHASLVSRLVVCCDLIEFCLVRLEENRSGLELA